jgi:hypothetical protein
MLIRGGSSYDQDQKTAAVNGSGTLSIEVSIRAYKILSVSLDSGSRDSSVGIATGYGLDDQGEREFESR